LQTKPWHTDTSGLRIYWFSRLEFRTGIIQNCEKTGKLGVNFGGNIGFWVKNGDWWVKLQGLGKPGKKKTFKNVQKRSKTFENVQKYSKIFKNIQKVGQNIQKRSKTCALLWARQVRSW